MKKTMGDGTREKRKARRIIQKNMYIVIKKEDNEYNKTRVSMNQTLRNGGLGRPRKHGRAI